MSEQRTYICIDLKSFYASVECVKRNLNPMTAKLVVADMERTEKTICLAVSPAMKRLGVKNRCRVFEIPKQIEYIAAPPRMKLYMDYAVRIYEIYLKYISKEDIHVYSIDEVFMDVTEYLSMYGCSAKELGTRIMMDIQKTTGIPATCGIGTNLYLAKVALDITAKHVKDKIGILDERTFRETLWTHQPLTDFWRIGSGTAERLKKAGIYTMKDIAYAREDLLYQMFGVDAELLIDHAWGRETVTMEDIKNYRPKSHSLTNGQVLACDYSYEKCRLVVKEMTDMLCLELVEQERVTESVSIYIGYSRQWGREASKGSVRLRSASSSPKIIIPYVLRLYEQIADRKVPIRRINICFNGVYEEACQQYDLFLSPKEQEKERRSQKMVLDIRKRFGKNMILRGMNLEEGATARERNMQIGGHRSGE